MKVGVSIKVLFVLLGSLREDVVLDKTNNMTPVSHIKDHVPFMSLFKEINKNRICRKGQWFF